MKIYTGNENIRGREVGECWEGRRRTAKAPDFFKRAIKTAEKGFFFFVCYYCKIL